MQTVQPKPPILSLPQEILEKIFLYLLYEQERQHRQRFNVIPLLMSSICRPWRQIVHSTPSLWKHVTVYYRHIYALGENPTPTASKTQATGIDDRIGGSEIGYPHQPEESQSQDGTDKENIAKSPVVQQGAVGSSHPDQKPQNPHHTQFTLSKQSEILHHFVTLAGNRLRLDLFYAGIDSDVAFESLSIILLQDAMFYKVETLRIFANNCPFIWYSLSLWALPLDHVKCIKVQGVGKDYRRREVDFPLKFFQAEALSLQVYTFSLTFGHPLEQGVHGLGNKLQVLWVGVAVMTDEELVTLLVSFPKLRRLSVITGMDIPSECHLPPGFVHLTLEELILNYAPSCLADLKPTRSNGTRTSAFPSLKHFVTCSKDSLAPRIFQRAVAESPIHTIGTFIYGYTPEHQLSMDLFKSFRGAKRFALYARPEVMAGALLLIGAFLANNLPCVKELELRDSAPDKNDPLFGDYLVRCLRARKKASMEFSYISPIEIVYHGMGIPLGVATAVEDIGVRLERIYEDD